MGMFIDFSKKNPIEMLSPTSEWEIQILDFITQWQRNTVFSIQTSGSTGKPKTIRCHKQQMIASATMTGEYFNFRAGQTALLCLPTNKISGIMMLVRAIVWQLKLYCVPPAITLPLDNLPTLDFAAMIPAQALHNLAQLQKVKKLLLGGAGLPPDLQRRYKSLPSESFLSYGMTETLSHIAIQRIGTHSYFQTLKGIRITTDERNCLVVDAPSLGIKALHTNDIVSLLANNKFKYLGRYDNIINSGGLKIIPETIEQQINPFISKQLFYVGTSPHPTWGEQLTLFIEGITWDIEKILLLKKQLKKIVPKQAIPQRIIFKKHFPQTSNGKIIRQ